MKKQVATWDMIVTLQRESATAGDRECHRLCARALAQSVREYPRRYKAFRMVEAILEKAKAMEEER